MDQNQYEHGIKEEEEEPDPDFIDQDLLKNEVKENQDRSEIKEENQDLDVNDQDHYKVLMKGASRTRILSLRINTPPTLVLNRDLGFTNQDPGLKIEEENQESADGIQEENPDSEPRNSDPAAARHQQVSARTSPGELYFEILTQRKEVHGPDCAHVLDHY